MGTYKLKMLLLGDVAVGKTDVIKPFIKGSFQKDYKMTIGCDIFTKDVMVNDGQDLVTLSIWDIAGQERFRFFRSSFYRGAAGALIFFDLTRYPTFNPSLVHWLRELWTFIGRIPVMVFGNKVELVNMRAVRVNDAVTFTQQIPCPYFESIHNMEAGLRSLAENMVNHLRYGRPPVRHTRNSKAHLYNQWAKQRQKSRLILHRVLTEMGFIIKDNKVEIINKFGLFIINLNQGTTFFKPIKCFNCGSEEICMIKRRLCIISGSAGWTNAGLLENDLLTLSKIYAISENSLPDHILAQMKQVSCMARNTVNFDPVIINEHGPRVANTNVDEPETIKPAYFCVNPVTYSKAYLYNIMDQELKGRRRLSTL